HLRATMSSGNEASFLGEADRPLIPASAIWRGEKSGVARAARPGAAVRSNVCLSNWVRLATCSLYAPEPKRLADLDEPKSFPDRRQEEYFSVSVGQIFLSALFRLDQHLRVRDGLAGHPVQQTKAQR